MRPSVAGVALFACSWVVGEELNAICSFETSVEYEISDGKVYADPLSAWGPIPVMTISDSMTSYDVSEDDANLATLSIMWTRVGEENVWSTWAGDFGDLLTVHSTSESMGTYTATLQSSHKLGATTFVGTCTGEF